MKRPPELSEMTVDDILKKEEPDFTPTYSEMLNLLFERKKIYKYSAYKQKHLGTKPYLVYSDIDPEVRKDIQIDAQKASDFYHYMKKWKEETAMHSSPAIIRMNRYYQKIIGLGDSIIPLILRELDREPNDWFYALEMLTKDDENPVTEEMGFNESTRAWINWGKDKGYI